MSFENGQDIPHTDNNLAGGYILLPAYDDSVVMDETIDETPVFYFAIKKDSINAFLGADDTAAEHWLSEFTYDDSTELYHFGSLVGTISYEWHPNLDTKVMARNICDNNALAAFVDFISGKLQENCFAEASKYLDTLFEQ